MTHLEFLIVFLHFILSVLLALGLGLFLIETLIKIFHIEKKDLQNNSAVLGGASILIGLGSLGYIGLIVGLIGQFNNRVIFPILIVISVISFRRLYNYLSLLSRQIVSISKSMKNDYLSLIYSSFIFFALGWLYLAAMQPPVTVDELAYHLPEAQLIVASQTVPLNVGGHFFYGNIPKLMEIIFAGAIIFSGYTLTHALNFLFFLSFLLITGGLLIRRYGIQTSLVAILFILSFNDLTWNATVGYIDAASVALELSALLLALDWLKTRARQTILISAVLIGLSLSIKYSALFTLIFIALIITWTTIREKRRFAVITKVILPFGLLAFLFSGFWYVKNFLLFGNPLYPLYFGHKGVDEAQYLSLINAIQQFGPKTFENFLDIPKKYLVPFPLNLPVFFSLYLAPISVFIRKGRELHLPLFIYFSSYSIYWFFLATHQKRFLMPAVIAALILTAILLTRLNRKILLCLTVFAVSGLFIYFDTIQSYFADKTKYALGLESKSEFLNRKLGCQYSVIENLISNKLEGNVVDNWSVWHDLSSDFYSPNNKFINFVFPVDTSNFDIVKRLKQQDIRYIYFKTNVKIAHLADQDALDIIYKKGREESEDYLLQRSSLIYENGLCKLYQITFNRFK